MSRASSTQVRKSSYFVIIPFHINSFEILKYLFRLVKFFSLLSSIVQHVSNYNNVFLSQLRTPRSPWACPVCKKARSKSKPPQRKKPTAEQLLKKEEQQQQQQNSKSKVSNSRVQSSKDLEPCRLVLTEMENHESSWPFLVPVNMKQVFWLKRYFIHMILSKFYLPYALILKETRK